jgi:nucleoside-diphosphate-sugar epimerase
LKVLFTGASSFTGFWFVRHLAAAGAEVTAALRGEPSAYAGVRAERARLLPQWAEIVPDCAFGTGRFVELIGARRFDVLCHHGAEARDYRNPDFDALGAAAANTFNIRETLALFAERGGKALIATGSVFEPEEGAGSAPRRAFSPYGLSKGLTFEIVKYWGETLGLPVSKFVIANPFGPFEESRFVTHAAERWTKGETLEVRTPRYRRDNIHVDLLSMAYARFVAEAAEGGEGRRFGPCGYVETQGAFAERLARELAPRLGLEGRVSLADQTDFAEPLARVNLDAIDPAAYGWDEGRAWAALARYYRGRGFGR